MTRNCIYVYTKGSPTIDCYNPANLSLTKQIKCGPKAGTAHHHEGNSNGTTFAVTPSDSFIAIVSKRDVVKVLDLQFGKKIVQLEHSNIQRVAFLSDDLLLIATNSYYAVYDVAKKENVVTVPCDATVVSAELNAAGTRVIAALSDGGISYVDLAAKKPVSSKCGAMNVRWYSDSEIVVVREKGSALEFTRVFIENDCESITVPEGGDADGKNRMESGKKRAANEVQTSVKGAGEKGSTAPAKRLRGDGDEGSGDEGASVEEEDNDPTVADKLASLSAALDADSDADSDDDEGDNVPADFAKTDSLSVLLSQALTSNDDANLEVCFNCTDKAMIVGTIKSLTPVNVMNLLTKIVERISRRPARASVLGVWLMCLMKCHAGLFMSHEILARKLAPVQGLLKERMETMGDLVRLDGRLGILDFLM
jgi:hypothetical protein